MPTETTSRRAVINAIERVEAISELASRRGDQYAYELDLEVSVYGRNYNGKRVGPYIRLLTFEPGEDIVREGDWGGNSFYVLVGGRADVFINTPAGEKKVSEIREGVQFGEMSVLAGVPRAATCRASLDQSANVLEIQRPALRLLRKMQNFSERLDASYRLNGRKATLQDLTGITGPSPELFTFLESISQFKVFSKNHILFTRGEPVRRLYLNRTGWVHLTRGELPDGERLLGPIHCFGLEGLASDATWIETGTLMGRAEVMEISISKLRQSELLGQALKTLATVSASNRDLATKKQLPIIQAQQRLIETGLVDGTNLLLMDMGLCVRCGNCSLACHQVHGQSRLVRRGIHVEHPESLARPNHSQSLLSPSVCMHCKDPECLTGCPTGAIQRLTGGLVDIDPKTCIGCGDCATQCPYNAISMVPRKKAVQSGNATGIWSLKPSTLPDPVDQTDDLLAVKCNLCAGTSLNPAGSKVPAYSCEENCPTGALLRVDPHIYFKEIRNVENLVRLDQAQGIARHTSHKDTKKRASHVAGILVTLAVSILTFLGISRYGLESPLISSWLNIRWLTGIVGLAGIAVVMTYPVRRQVYRRRAGPLRYWLLLHEYIGVIAGVVLLMHGGMRSGGLLTTLLMVSFDLAIASGLFGAATYLVIPRILTSIEEQPLLLEDLEARRTELRSEIAAGVASLPANVKESLTRKILNPLMSTRYLLMQYLSRRSLDDQIAMGISMLGDTSSGDPLVRTLVSGLVEKVVTLRRVDALIYLHRALKVWLLPHVVSTSLMLALMLVHIVQVVYFAVR
jgi:Fe-S-cluster-containing dehydrogenase component/CRP-like cAMP-binding protein